NDGGAPLEADTASVDGFKRFEILGSPLRSIVIKKFNLRTAKLYIVAKFDPPTLSPKIGIFIAIDKVFACCFRKKFFKVFW
ncbi:hypothetical protein COX03_03455, partial [Candidatus Woesebacteria bacterium CG22_combo_CG10-13_8_21_14_all_39_10]